MIKLVYIHGGIGCIARPDGKIFKKTDIDYNGEEEYKNKEEAIKIAEAYVVIYPLNYCQITDEDNKSQIIFGDADLHSEALEQYKKQQVELGKKHLIKSRVTHTLFYIVIVAIIYLIAK